MSTFHGDNGDVRLRSDGLQGVGPGFIGLVTAQNEQRTAGVSSVGVDDSLGRSSDADARLVQLSQGMGIAVLIRSNGVPVG